MLLPKYRASWKIRIYPSSVRESLHAVATVAIGTSGTGAKGVVKPLYFTLLTSIEYRFAISAGTTSVGTRVKLTSGFVAKV